MKNRRFIPIALVFIIGMTLCILAPNKWQAALATTSVEKQDQINQMNESETETWDLDSRRLKNLKSENLTVEDRCNITWDTLWKWSKKGNLQARASLFFFSYPVGAHSSVINLPGRDGDDLTQQRDVLILGIHSLGVNFEEESLNRSFSNQTKIVFEGFLNDRLKKEPFYKCFIENSDQSCTKIAEQTLIPSFESYAKEIDALISSGMKPNCSFSK